LLRKISGEFAMTWGLRAVSFLAAFLAVSTAGGRDAAKDADEMVLSVEHNGTCYAWELRYGRARRMALEFIAEGEPAKALEAAKMQFIICPPPFDPPSTEAAIKSVNEALVALDGNDKRAGVFERYATYGPDGIDGKSGTADDLSDPLRGVRLTLFKRDAAFYRQFDETIVRRAELCSRWERAWYDTERAYARLEGAEFETARATLMETLKSMSWLAHEQSGDWELQKIQDIVDRTTVGLGVVYRAKTGTVAGLDAFITNCVDYAKYGQAGTDGVEGTADDLEAPI